MKRSKSRRKGLGRIFRRRSRLTGAELPTWWIAWYDQHGKEQRKSSKTDDYEAAQAVLIEKLDQVKKGTAAEPRFERLTVDDLMAKVLAHYEYQGHHSAKTVEGHAKRWREAAGNDEALKLDTDRVRRIMSAWKRDVSEATCNRRLAILRVGFHRAKLIINPQRLDFAELFLEEPTRRGSYIPPADFAVLNAGLPDYLRDFQEVAYQTGLRKTQLCRTTWAHYHHGAKGPELRWTSEETKTKEAQTLALAGRVLAIIEARRAVRRLHCPYIFHGRRCREGREPSKAFGCVGDFRKVWQRAVEGAGFRLGRTDGGIVWHNHRHSAVTNLCNAGVPKHEAKSISGHRTDSVFNRYSIASADGQRNALEATAHLTGPSRLAALVPLRKVD